MILKKRAERAAAARKPELAPDDVNESVAVKKNRHLTWSVVT